jgi:hypothetical protein
MPLSVPIPGAKPGLIKISSELRYFSLVHGGRSILFKDYTTMQYDAPWKQDPVQARKAKSNLETWRDARQINIKIENIISASWFESKLANQSASTKFSSSTNKDRLQYLY